jgi:FKBP-type peptidyl-prolyl cis-trans isomerase
MKTIKSIFLVIILTAISTLKMSAQNTEQDVNQANSLDSFSYAIGYSVASNLVKSGVDTLAYEQLVEGFKDFLTRQQPKIDEAKINDVIQNYLGNLAKSKHEGNLTEGETFLAENAKKEGVQTTATGLQYKVLTVGTGAKPVDGDNVTTHYTGRLIDGSIFDSSVQRGEPTSFGVNQVIPGWTEALKLMPAGSKWELYIPYNLAYGERDMGNIKPFSCLIFELELISIAPQ